MQTERRKFTLCRGAARLRSVIKITLQRYNENPDGAILKIECFTIGICSASNETRLARNRYLLDVYGYIGLDVGHLIRRLVALQYTSVT